MAGTSHPGPPSSRGALEIILTQNRGVPRTATARTLMVSGPLTLSGDVAADQRGEMALPRATAAAARSDQPEQRHRFGHAFEFVAAALLGDEQTRDLAYTRAVTTTAPGSAIACARAAMFGTSP